MYYLRFLIILFIGRSKLFRLSDVTLFGYLLQFIHNNLCMLPFVWTTALLQIWKQINAFSSFGPTILILVLSICLFFFVVVVVGSLIDCFLHLP